MTLKEQIARIKVTAIGDFKTTGWYFREYPNEWQPIPDEKAVVDALNSGADSVDLGNGWRGELLFSVDDNDTITGATIAVHHWDDVDLEHPIADLFCDFVMEA